MKFKRAVQVSIEPWDGAVNQAVQKINQIDSSLLKNVQKIVVHSGGGSGQLGHVESGPGKNPFEIHIFKDRIREHVMRNANASSKETVTQNELNESLINGIIECISHEGGHIAGWKRTPEQIEQGPFLGEPEAEQTSKNIMNRVSSSIVISKRVGKVLKKKL